MDMAKCWQYGGRSVLMTRKSKCVKILLSKNGQSDEALFQEQFSSENNVFFRFISPERRKKHGKTACQGKAATL